MSKRLGILLISAFSLLPAEALGQGPQIYISTFNGNQIQTVNPNTGTQAMIYSDTSGSGANFLPEGITLGQDGKVYVCVPVNNKILRMNQDGTQPETVYDFSKTTSTTCNGGACPTGPEGPSIDANGNLFFNTRGSPATHTGIWEIAGVTAIPFLGTFPAPTNVVTAAQTGSTFGEGTAFGGTFPTLTRLTVPATRSKQPPQPEALKNAFPTISGLLASAGPLRGMLPAAFAAPPPSSSDPNLLIVDHSGNRILIWNGTSVATLISASSSDSCSPLCIENPIGIAVNPMGDIFVANAGSSTKNVNHFLADGTFIETYASDFTETCGAEVCPNDIPAYLAFDPFGNLFVTTNASLEGGGGNVWEVTSATTMTRITNNPSTFTGSAVGITLATITLPLNPNGGQNNYVFGQYNYKVQYPADPNFAGETLAVTAIPTTQAQLTSQTNGGPFKGALIVPYAGVSDNDGVTFETLCLASSGGPCASFTESYVVLTSYNGPVPGNPVFLKKPDTAPIYDNSPPLPSGNGNILTNFYPMRIDPTAKGNTCCGYSDYIVADLPPGQTTAATFNGFLTPLALKNGRVFTSGDTLAVKFTLTGKFSSFDPTKVQALISVEMVSTSQGTAAANFKGISPNKFTFLKGTYQFYLNLTGYAPGNYLLIVTSNSFKTQSVTFTVQ